MSPYLFVQEDHNRKSTRVVRLSSCQETPKRIILLTYFHNIRCQSLKKFLITDHLISLFNERCVCHFKLT
jgi:hypothetical protein